MQTKKLLIIESDAAVREGIKKSLEGAPIQYVEVTEPDDAVMQVAVEGPDLIVLAMELSSGDSTTLLSIIREFDRNVPIVAITGQPTKEKIILAKRYGCDDILLKPPDYARLAKSIITICETPILNMPMAREDPEIPPPTDPPTPEELSEFEIVRKEMLSELAQTEEFVEAIPKGAEVLNINDAIGGMKLARTLVLNNVIYGEKGQILTAEKIKQLTRIGIPEVCIYINEDLKRIVEHRKNERARAAAIRLEEEKAVPLNPDAENELVLAATKRAAVRVPLNEKCLIRWITAEGENLEAPGIVFDISSGGCGVYTAEQFKKGDEVTLTFTLDRNSFKMDNVRALIRHTEKDNTIRELPYKNGIFFSGITERFRENLVNVLFKIQRENKAKGKVPLM